MGKYEESKQERRVVGFGGHQLDFHYLFFPYKAPTPNALEGRLVESMRCRITRATKLLDEQVDTEELINTKTKHRSDSDKMITKSYRSMQEITYEDYQKFLEKHDHVVIENVKVLLPKKHKITRFAPENFTPESTTVWSFHDRGDWTTHLGNYRGNWSPYIPRNLILRYTKKDDLVLDQMAGSGTTLVECKLLQRRGIGVDINPDAVMVMRNRLDFKYKPIDEDYEEPEIKTYVGDARNLHLIEDESIDLIATHPPYAGIISYSNQRVEGDLSNVRNIAGFVEEMHKVAEESYRVLKPNKHCAILIGDTRKHKHFVPITPRVLQSFLDVGFILREDIIKMQWKMKSTREKWRGKYDFLLIAHEHLHVFRKPEEGEKLSQFKESIKWWNKEEKHGA